MHSAKPKRRWLQFSLRSLLLLTLGVALWLGYEVRQVRLVEQHRKAIEALGGNVETEPCGWSLLRFMLHGDFGRQVVVAEIPGAAADDAIETLAAMPFLRHVRAVYDGTCDVHPGWDRLDEAMPGKTIEAVGEVENDVGAEDPSPRMKRFSQKMEQGPAKVQQLLRDLKQGVTPPEGFHVFLEKSYYVRRLADGTVVELLVGNNLFQSISGTDTAFAVLIVGDRAVDGVLVELNTRRGSQKVQLLDVDGDGCPEVGFEYNPSAWWPLEDARRIPGDSRDWLGLYKIERGGFKSLLLENNPTSS